MRSCSVAESDRACRKNKGHMLNGSQPMVRIYIVDDEREAAEALDRMMSRYAEEAGVAIDMILF